MISGTPAAGISSDIQVIPATRQANPKVATAERTMLRRLSDIIVLEEVAVADRGYQLYGAMPANTPIKSNIVVLLRI